MAETNSFPAAAAAETRDHTAALKRILRFLPAPVGIVTSVDPETDEPIGLAMSAIMPVSLDPCAVAIAVNRAGSAHAGIVNSGHFCINLLDPATGEHLGPFGDPTRRAERFKLPGWRRHNGVMLLDAAPASIICAIAGHTVFGTHDVLIGDVREIHSSGMTTILGWADGALGTLQPLP